MFTLPNLTNNHFKDKLSKLYQNYLRMVFHLKKVNLSESLELLLQQNVAHNQVLQSKFPRFYRNNHCLSVKYISFYYEGLDCQCIKIIHQSMS